MSESCGRGYPPIGDYGAIGDCHTIGLISRAGSLEWLCLPHFSGPSVFAALLDQGKGGRFAIGPCGEYRVARRYAGATNILETTFRTAGGVVRLTDFMSVVHARTSPVLQPEREVVRVLEGLEGTVEVEVIYQPRPDYARVKPRLEGSRRLGWACRHRDYLLNLQTDLPLEAQDDSATLYGRAWVAAGQRHHFSLGYVRHTVGVTTTPAEAEDKLRTTREWWEGWSASCTYDGPCRDAVLRSVLALKLLTFAPSGAVLAAGTTSLPEKLGGAMTWDYRFCWLRDAGHVMSSFVELGFEAEGDAFLRWLLHSTRLTAPELQVLYDAYGNTEIPEQRLDHLEGYAGSRPVRAGNAAEGQLQLDTYGEVALAACGFVERTGDQIDRLEASLLAGFADVVRRRWREPDNGIWEARGERQHYTYSKLMCWTALDRLLKLHEARRIKVDADALERECRAIRETIETQGFNERLNSYTGVLGAEDVDAALLLMPRSGYIAAGHPRMIGTYEYMRRRLERNGLFYRYAHGRDEEPGGGNAFGICCFWAVDYLARRGDVDAACARFERVLECANDLGLFAEEIDPVSRAARGNFPQAFTHTGLITSALTLADALKRPKKR